MIKLIEKTFIKGGDPSDPAVRTKYIMLSGVLGIICNAVLFALKLTIGLVSASIAVISDAFNNLSDMGTSIVSIVTARLSGKRPDREHPFGHGRIEYIATLLMSMIIVVVGVELLKSSVKSIFNPSPVNLSVPVIIILAASILIKVWMFFYNRYLGKKIGSALLEATAKDSLGDCISTVAVVVGALLLLVFSGSRFDGTFWQNIPFDGIIGVFVSLLILRNGFVSGKEVVDVLLGKPPEPELVKELEKRVLAGKDILGVHDLIVHDYGPGRVFASVHAEVPYNGDVMEIHETIDMIEHSVNKDLGVVFVIHMDPVVHDSPRVDALKELAARICTEIDPSYTIHDFRITEGDEHANLIFDLVVPPETSGEKRREIDEYVKRRLSEEDKSLHAVINIESGY